MEGYLKCCQKEHGAHNTMSLRSKNENHISPDSECAQCEVKIYKKKPGKDVKKKMKMRVM